MQPNVITVKIAALSLNANNTDLWMPVPSNSWVLLHAFASNGTISMNLAAGGIYTAASKGGNALVAAGQTYANLTGAAADMQTLTLAAVASTKRVTTAGVYLNLTTGQGSAGTADFYLVIAKFD